MTKLVTLGLALSILLACSSTPKKNSTDSAEYLGTIEIMDESALALLDADSKLEILAEGHDWTEGPVWLESEQLLLYSDIPPNSIFAWKEGEGSQLFLKPSGYTGRIDREGEPGSNGLLLDPLGNLVLCQHGDRRISRFVGDLKNPQPSYETIADRWEGKMFNSPNDAAYHRTGMLYFTDPPYGLEKNMDDPSKEISFQGVYRINLEGEVEVLIDSITRPNGIAFSPDHDVLYVACSDPKKARWYRYELDDSGTILNGGELFDVSSMVGKEKGLPDGLKVHPSGVLFATGPGGVWLLSDEGTPLALIRTGEATANCAFNQDHSELFITADMYLLRLRLRG